MGDSNKSARAVGYAVALVEEEIICSRGFEPVVTVDNMAQVVIDMYHLATSSKQAEMGNLVGNF
jgi:hypothetical protein